MDWLKTLATGDSFIKALAFVGTLLVSHFLLHMSWQDAYNTAITAYVGGGLVLPSKPATPAA